MKKVSAFGGWWALRLCALVITLCACQGNAPTPKPTMGATPHPTQGATSHPTQGATPATGATPQANAPISTQPPNSASRQILIGMEYALIENPQRVKTLAQMLAPIGAPMAKHYPEHVEWGEMQKSATAPIDFNRLDAFVREFQAAGFSELVITLKSHSPWASKLYGKLNSPNPSPKDEYLNAYAQWIFAIVERYDADGQNDMPALRYPVRFYEIGSEFSSYEPESPEDYLTMLERAYHAAHRAMPQVVVAHVAFLTTTVFRDKPQPAEYSAAFAAAPTRFMVHRLPAIRKILERPDLFDVVNLHSLGDPYEIEENVKWLNYEMQQRNYHKPIILSDTLTTPWIAWGPATVCDKPASLMGLIIPPATEADRCRLAAYFTKLVDGDEDTVRWTQAFAAEDMVKRVVIAAEQNILLINTVFIEDLVWLKLKVFQAGTGPSAWAGMLDVERKERRASFYALQQLVRQLKGYESIKRLPMGNEGIRVYEVSKNGKRLWLAWYETGKVSLPADAVPQTTIDLHVGKPSLIIEPLITRFSQTTPERKTQPTTGQTLKLSLTPTPLFIIEP